MLLHCAHAEVASVERTIEIVYTVHAYNFIHALMHANCFGFTSFVITFHERFM